MVLLVIFTSIVVNFASVRLMFLMEKVWMNIAMSMVNCKVTVQQFLMKAHCSIVRFAAAGDGNFFLSIES